MSRIAYVNGLFVPHRQALVHVEDRGYQFADGVYEVAAVYRGRLVDEDGHMARLGRSLDELRIAWPVAPQVLRLIAREMTRRNRIECGLVYTQITRGVAPRNHAFPKGVRSALVMTARHGKPFDPATTVKGVSVVTVPDIRWKRCDIKTVSLLPNVLARQAAVEAGAAEAWLVDERGRITEGAATNAWIVTADNELVTRQADQAILRGITRQTVMSLVHREGLRLVERPFTVAEARGAAEAFLTSTTNFIKPVVRLDGHPIGKGREAGPITRRLVGLYAEYLAKFVAGR
jgi:D-alanine transaminase